MVGVCGRDRNLTVAVVISETQSICKLLQEVPESRFLQKVDILTGLLGGVYSSMPDALLLDFPVEFC